MKTALLCQMIVWYLTFLSLKSYYFRKRNLVSDICFCQAELKVAFLACNIFRSTFSFSASDYIDCSIRQRFARHCHFPLSQYGVTWQPGYEPTIDHLGVGSQLEGARSRPDQK